MSRYSPQKIEVVFQTEQGTRTHTCESYEEAEWIADSRNWDIIDIQENIDVNH